MDHQDLTGSKLSAALQLLPHGPQFRFIDRLSDLEPGRSGIGEYTVRDDDPYLRGHFPGEPLFPGVLLVEAAAQLAGVVAQSDPHVPPLKNLKLTALRAVKLFGTARPGEIIRVEVRELRRFENLVHAHATASINGKLVMQAELTLSGEPS
ncbi:MAG: beta-hydroxyacyl-ACP dehydratase [Verrucomicrobia bacterium]|nr:beta-hydroxyacyl-ACP dehydratase [Verrucomicrobiota bacterium]